MISGTGVRRGFTLIELMIGLVFAMAVAAVTHRLILASQRSGRAQVEHAGMQDNVRAGALMVAGELRELGFDSVAALAELGPGTAASSDILLAQAGRIRYRGMRGLGFTCSTPTSAEIRLRAATYHGARQPVGGVDSVSIFVEGDPALAEDDGWLRAGVAAVAAGACADGAPGILLSLSWLSPAADAAGARMVAGGPVRIFEIMELQYYRQERQSWLGMRSLSRGEVIQPLIGPLADSTATVRGFTLGYLDRNDNATAVPTEVRTITVGLRGVTAQAVRRLGGGGLAVDSFALSTRVALRNMVRP